MARIPNGAKQVFKGIVFEVYQWPQKMYDGSIKTFEMLKRDDTVQIIATNGNKVIVSHQEQPTTPHFHSLFGGHVEPGEGPLDAAKRELLEEAGLESNDWELVKVYEPHSKIDWNIYLYVARDCIKSSVQKLDAGEKIECIELNFKEFLDFVTSEKFHWAALTKDLLLMEKQGNINSIKQKLFKK